MQWDVPCPACDVRSEPFPCQPRSTNVAVDGHLGSFHQILQTHRFRLHCHQTANEIVRVYLKCQGMTKWCRARGASRELTGGSLPRVAYCERINSKVRPLTAWHRCRCPISVPAAPPGTIAGASRHTQPRPLRLLR